MKATVNVNAPGLKGLIHQKETICWISNEYSVEEMLHYMTCSIMDPLHWMGTIRMRQTRDFSWKQWFEVKNVLMMDLFLTNLQRFTSQDINWLTGVVWIACGLLWCLYQLFGLSFWWHPFTAEDPLVSKWCNVTFLQILLKKHSSTTWMTWGGSKLSANFYFWMIYSSKSHSPSLDVDWCSLLVCGHWLE